MSIAGVAGGGRRVAIVAGVRDATALLKMLLRTEAVIAGVVAHEQPSSGRAGLTGLTSRARASGIPVFAPHRATVPVALDWLRNLALDYVVCVGWSRFLTEELVRVPRHGTVGMWRMPRLGIMAPDWAQLRGDTLTGHPMLVLAPGPAAGELKHEARNSGAWPDGRVQGEPDVYDVLAQIAMRLLATEAADVTESHPAEHRVTEPALATSLPPLGLTSFDRSADEVQRWVKALGYPRTGAFARLRGDIVRIWSCEAAGSTAVHVPAGILLGTDDRGVVVTTRSGTVRLLEVQTVGKGPEAATTWFGGSDLPPGCAFEPVSWSVLGWMFPGSGGGTGTAGA